MRIEKRKILHILGIVVWLMIGTGIVTLLVSAIKKETATTCKEVLVNFTDKKNYRMVSEQEIFSALWPGEKNKFPKNQIAGDFDLYKLEKQLEKNPWILSADLYFDQKQKMHIDVEQRQPIARVFTPTGNSYFMDEEFFILPLKSNDIISVPVFTNFYFSATTVSKNDSIVLGRVASLSSFILSDPFWMAQIEAVNINADNSFELTPQVGNHVIMLGDRSDWSNVFTKLKTFYQYINTENAWNKYTKIDLQFKNQIIGVRNNSVRYTVDSLVVLGTEKIKLDSAIMVKATPVKEFPVKTEKQKHANKSLTVTKPKALMPAQKNKNK
jgi:cell division protein FtsQ